MRMKGIKNHGYNHIEFIGNLIEITSAQISAFVTSPIQLTNGETDLDNGKVHTDLDLESLEYAFSRQYESIAVYAKIGDDIYPLKLQAYPDNTNQLLASYWEINTIGSTLLKITINGDLRDNADKGVFIQLADLSGE